MAVVFHKEGLTFSGKEDPFQKLQLQIIGAVAQFERAMIKAVSYTHLDVYKRQHPH